MSMPTLEQETEVAESEDQHLRITRSLDRAELKLSDAVFERLMLLEQHSKFNEHARQIEQAVDNLLDYLAKQDPKFRVSNTQRKEALGAAVVHDIGKSGPADAAVEQQMAVVTLFNINIKKKPEEVTVAEAIEESSNQADLLTNLLACKITPDMTMRQFYDQHAFWTKDNLEKHQVGTGRMRIIAATHHADRGINPYDLPEAEIPWEAVIIGSMENYLELLEERALMVVDKYESARSRSGRKMSHDEAMAVVKRILKPMMDKDKMLELVVNAVDELGRAGKLFENQS